MFQATRENNLVCATANSPPAHLAFCGKTHGPCLLNMPPSSYGSCPPERQEHCSFPPMNTTASKGGPNRAATYLETQQLQEKHLESLGNLGCSNSTGLDSDFKVRMEGRTQGRGGLKSEDGQEDSGQLSTPDPTHTLLPPAPGVPCYLFVC